MKIKYVELVTPGNRPAKKKIIFLRTLVVVAVYLLYAFPSFYTAS